MGAAVVILSCQVNQITGRTYSVSRKGVGGRKKEGSDEACESKKKTYFDIQLARQKEKGNSYSCIRILQNVTLTFCSNVVNVFLIHKYFDNSTTIKLLQLASQGHCRLFYLPITSTTLFDKFF